MASAAHKMIGGAGSVPAVLPSSPFANYDASVLTGTDGQTLSSWPGVSGPTLSSSVPGMSFPSWWKTTTANMINGQPAVSFSGTQATVAASAISQSQAFTVAVIAKPSEAISANTYYFVSSNTGATDFYAQTNAVHLYAGTATSGVGTYDTNAHLFVGIFNGSSSTIQVDGTSGSGLAAGAGALSGAFAVGNGSSSSSVGPFKGLMGQVVMWSRALSGSDLASLRAYSKAKWGTP